MTGSHRHAIRSAVSPGARSATPSLGIQIYTRGNGSDLMAQEAVCDVMWMHEGPPGIGHRAKEWRFSSLPS